MLLCECVREMDIHFLKTLLKHKNNTLPFFALSLTHKHTHSFNIQIFSFYPRPTCLLHMVTSCPLTPQHTAHVIVVERVFWTIETRIIGEEDGRCFIKVQLLYWRASTIRHFYFSPCSGYKRHIFI